MDLTDIAGSQSEDDTQPKGKSWGDDAGSVSDSVELQCVACKIKSKENARSKQRSVPTQPPKMDWRPASVSKKAMIGWVGGNTQAAKRRRQPAER